MSSRSSRSEDVYPEPGCNFACAVCDCRHEATSGLERVLGLGGARLEIRGEAATQRTLAETIARARQSGWERIAVRTNGAAFAEPARARSLVELGVDEIVFFLASERPNIHDAIARIRGAHTRALQGLASFAATDVAVRLETPVLSPSLQDLTKVLDLVPTARSLRLFSPERLWEGAGPVPRELSPPRWSDVRAAVAAVLDRADARGVEYELGDRDGIPLCGVVADGESRLLLRDRPNRPRTRTAASRLATACAQCAGAATCPGVTDLYLSTHGDAGLRPRLQPARELVRTRVRLDAQWDDERRSAARRARIAVVRPTVDCNQDCWFCSANETSRNVEADPGRMSRRIVRLARSGVNHVSFSGGEPTLSKHLVHYVAVARAAGVEHIELVTNAALLDRPEKVDALAEAGVNRLFVSLHGHDEATSRAQTRKVGDHARTVRALELFAERTSAILRVNHVITTRNARALVRFVEWVSERFGTRVSISFAFLTPQYKALDRLAEGLPRYRELAPFLKKALARAAELDVECVVGSRQGVPPCQLDEFAVFSDVTRIADNALAEDVPQKIKPESCRGCRFDAICTGVWRVYAERHGLDELVPVPGQPVRAGDDLSTALGVRSLRASAELPAPAEPERVRLEVLDERPPLRVALIGSGSRALRLLAAARAANLQVIGVASPHAPEKDLPELPAGCVRARSLDELLAQVSPEGVLVASATADHAASATSAIARGLPVLVEKPFAVRREDALELIRRAEAAGTPLGVAHQMRLAPGFQELLREARGPFELRIRRTTSPRSAEALHAWNRGSLFEVLVHLADLAIAALGTSVKVDRARSVGGSRPESYDVSGRSARGRFTIAHDFQADDDALVVEVSGTPRVTWTRTQGGEELTIHDASGARHRSPPRGNDLERLLASWATSVRVGGPPPVSAIEGEAAMRVASEALEALELFGTAFDRPGAPRHASSRELRDRR